MPSRHVLQTGSRELDLLGCELERARVDDGLAFRGPVHEVAVGPPFATLSVSSTFAASPSAMAAFASATRASPAASLPESYWMLARTKCSRSQVIAVRGRVREGEGRGRPACRRPMDHPEVICHHLHVAGKVRHGLRLFPCFQDQRLVRIGRGASVCSPRSCRGTCRHRSGERRVVPRPVERTAYSHPDRQRSWWWRCPRPPHATMNHISCQRECDCDLLHVVSLEGSVERADVRHVVVRPT